MSNRYYFDVEVGFENQPYKKAKLEANIIRAKFGREKRDRVRSHSDQCWTPFPVASIWVLKFASRNLTKTKKLATKLEAYSYKYQTHFGDAELASKV